MSRIKKTRSLKRIHSTKTGSKTKLKKELQQLGPGHQAGKRVQGRKQLSAYEKYLLENPEAERTLPKAKKSADKSQPTAAVPLPEEQAKPQRPKSLLDQLDEKGLKDIY